MIAWFSNVVASSLPDLHRQDAVDSRDDVIRLVHTPRDPFDEHHNIPLFICRHVLCSESTSFVGFLPDIITKRSISAFDPVPPTTASSSYNNDYFSGVKRPRMQMGTGGPQRGQHGQDETVMREVVRLMNDALENHLPRWRAEFESSMRALLGGGGALDAEREAMLRRMMEIAEEVAGPGDGNLPLPLRMPGAFPEEDE
jgi:hypothetical protein